MVREIDMTDEEIAEEANRRAVIDLTNQGRLGIASVIASGCADEHPEVLRYIEEVKAGTPFTENPVPDDAVMNTPFVVDVGVTPEVAPKIG
jgi:hypothetical protein